MAGSYRADWCITRIAAGNICPFDSWNTVRSSFKSAELCRFSPDGQDFGVLFMREDAERARCLSL